MRTKFLVLSFFATLVLQGQIDQKNIGIPEVTSCNFIFEADSSINGKTFKVIGYLLDGCDVNATFPSRSKIGDILQTTFPLTKEFFAHQFKDVCVIDNCTLDKVGAYKMSTPGEIMLIISYRGKQ